MRRLLPLALALALLQGACTGRGALKPSLPARPEDPGPLVELLEDQLPREALAATLLVDHRGPGERFQGKSYLLLSPPGRMRLEVPGWMGSTLLLLVCDGESCWAWFPEEGTAYRTGTGNGELSAILPFPLPLSPLLMPDLLTGTLPPAARVTGAVTLGDGASRLSARAPGELELAYTFTPPPSRRLREVVVSGEDSALTILFREEGGAVLPSSFRYRGRRRELEVRLERVNILPRLPGGSYADPVPAGVRVLETGG